MSFNRADYEELVKMARDLWAMDCGSNVDDIAEKLFHKAEGVIGQQSPPLFPHDLNPMTGD